MIAKNGENGISRNPTMSKKAVFSITQSPSQMFPFFFARIPQTLFAEFLD
jgi:hypothetical protein